MMSLPRPPLMPALILLCAGLCLSPRMRAATAADGDEVISPPPMAQPAQVSIYQGQSVDIPLKVVGRTTPPLRFFIRTQPVHGTLSNLRVVGSDSAEITYTHTDTDGPGEDSFTFASQAAGTPVSAPGRVDITVSEEPPALSFDHELNFGSVYLGGSSSQDFVLRNTGGGMLVGRISVPPPWSITGSADYQIGRRGKAVIHLTFTPTEARKFLSSMDFSGDVGETVALEGVGMQPFGSSPKALEFRAASGEATRTATVTIKNNADIARTVQLSLPENITGPATVEVPAGGSTDVTLQAGPSFGSGETGHVSLASGGFSQDVPFTVFAPPPSLEVTSGDRIDFGDVLPGRQYERKLTLINKSDVTVELHAEYPPEIELNPDPNGESLQAGASASYDVIFESGTASAWDGKITVSAVGGATSRISLSAKSTAQPDQSNAIPTAKLTRPDIGLPVDEGQSASSYNGIPPISHITVFKTGRHFLELAWPVVPQAVAYRVEQRILITAPNTQPKIGWKDVKLIKFREENGNVIVRFDRLPTGRSWVIRISSVDRSGASSEPTKILRIMVPAYRPWHIPLWFWMLGVIALAWWQWRRRSGADDRDDAERIARLGKS